MTIRCVVLLTCLLLAAAASTQTPAAQDFSGLAATQTSIDVVTDTGTEARGRLLRFDADSLTMARDRGEVTFDRQHVVRVYQRGDSLKNGMFIGLAVGAALGMSVGLTTECGGFFEASRDCTAGEKARLAGMGSALPFGASSWHCWTPRGP